jgi:DNA repair exonuclease SbcCD nuclease subunit
MADNPPNPKAGVANIFVFHGAVDLPDVKPPYIEAELSPEQLPAGFCYYAAGHVHERFSGRFKDGLLVYSGCVETVGYDEARYVKGFYHVKVNEKGQTEQELVELTSPRRFIILEQDYSGMTSAKITESATQLVKEADEAEAIIIPVLKGTLPTEASRTEIDIGKIRGAGERALLVHPILQLKETAVSDEIVRSIFEGEFKDLKTKAYEYFVQIFSERYGREDAEKVAKAALNLIEPLSKKQDEKIKQTIEALSK